MATNARITLGDNESIERALKRFKRLVEKAGVKKEAKQRRHYVSPGEKRREEKRKQARNRRKGDKKSYGKKQRPVYYISPPEPKPTED